MSRLIDADKLKDAVYKSFTPYQREWASTINQINKAIDAQPTVEAVPVVRGEWIPERIFAIPGDKGSGIDAFKCSVCGNIEVEKHPFCNCGVDMRKKELDEGGSSE